jgi:hypothetical protein
VAEATYYRWKKVYAGMGVSEIRRLKQLEEENSKLKRLVADLALDKTMLQNALLKKKVVKPVCRREVIRHYQEVFALSERRACRAITCRQPFFSTCYGPEFAGGCSTNGPKV